MPQYHVGGWNIQPLLAWWMGATVVLERTFDPGRVLHLIQERRITTMMGVPANYLFLAQHPDFAAHRPVEPRARDRRRCADAAGAAADLARSRGRAHPGLRAHRGGAQRALPPRRGRPARVGSAGKPYPHVDVAVADPVTGEHLEGAAEGELLVRGPIVFAGYFRDPEATAA